MASKRVGPPLSPPPLKRKFQSTNTSKAVASFFKPASQKEPERLSWKIVQKSLITGKYVPESASPNMTRSTPRKIAAFDLDDTLITSKTGQKFARSASGWRWLHNLISTKLKELDTQGYTIVILSNQGNVSLKENPKSLQHDTPSLTNLKSQLGAVLQQLDLPISFYAATGQDNYRKPRVGMWEAFIKDHELEVPNSISLQDSFYVGDAAGRPKTTTRLKDHACSDRDLAANIGIHFHTPEEYFLGSQPEPFDRVFEPSQFLGLFTESSSNAVVEQPFKKLQNQDMVMFCGSPGAGKSTFFWTRLQSLGYIRINQDILKTRDKCLKTAKEHLMRGESVVVDNTNAGLETRAYWIELAQSFKIPIRCVHFTASTRLCEHNSTVRALGSQDVKGSIHIYWRAWLKTNQMNPEKRQSLPPVAFRSFASRYVPPVLSEGFHDIITVDFTFEGALEQRQGWSQYWVSKFST